MKTNNHLFRVGRALRLPFLIAILASGALALQSCGTLSKTWHAISGAVTYSTTPQTAEQIIVDAEKTVAIAGETFDEFLKQERRYSAEVKQYVPKVHEFAEYLRAPVANPDVQPATMPPIRKTIPRGVAFLKAARSATKTFEANRTPAGEANLKTALSTLKDLIAKTKQNLTEVQALKGP